MTTMILLIDAAVGLGLGLGVGLGEGLEPRPTPPHPIAASMKMTDKTAMARVNVCTSDIFETAFFRAVGLIFNSF